MDGGSLRLEVGSANNFAPFFGFVDNELFEFGKRRWHRLGAELGEFSLRVRIGDAVIDRFAQRLDDRIRRPLRRAEAEPADAVIAGHELGNGRNVRQRLSARLPT